MIKDGQPYCERCWGTMPALTEEEAEAELLGCGWSDWRTARMHYHRNCMEALMDEVGYPPCGECRTRPCERGRECWANPPLDLFPYETYIAGEAPDTLAKDPRQTVLAQEGWR